MPQLSQDPEEAFVQNAQENEVGARRLIRDLVQAEKPTPFHFILGRILEKAIVENKRVALDPDADISDLAWAARNLMELLIWSRYIRQSEANLKRFENDFYVNAALTMQALLRLQNDFGKEFPDAIHHTKGCTGCRPRCRKREKKRAWLLKGRSWPGIAPRRLAWKESTTPSA